MIRAQFFRLFRWNLKSSLRWWWPVAALALVAFIGWRGALEAIEVFNFSQPLVMANVWDAFFITFAGPGLWDTTLLRMLGWFVPHLLFFYFIGDLANGELSLQGAAVVPLIGSRLRWWWGKMFLLAVLSVGYTILCLFVVLAVSLAQLPWSWQGGTLLNSGTLIPISNPVSGAELLSWVFVLLSSTLFAMSCFQTTWAILRRRSFYGFVAVSMVLLLSWLLGSENPHLVRWLPGSQSMLLRHTLFDQNVFRFSFQWSFIYNAVQALLMVCIGAWYVKRMDIFGVIEDIG